MIGIFCCHAHEDKGFLDALRKHLGSLQRQKVIEVWDDANISAGTERKQEIQKHLKNAKIIVLLISPDFIGSDDYYNTEMQYAWEQHQQGKTRVISVLLRPVDDWKNVPLGNIKLGDFYALPKDDKAIIDWSNHDLAWKEVTEEIRKVVNELRGKPHQTLSSDLSPQKKPSNSFLRRRTVLIGLGVMGITRSTIALVTHSTVLVVLVLVIAASSVTWLLHLQQSSLQSNPHIPASETARAQSSTMKTFVDVQAKSDWQNSGVLVPKGVIVTVEYVSGHWRPWPGVNFDGIGCTQHSMCADQVTNNILIGCNHGGLIGRVGSAQMICILNGKMVTATESGALYLRINDQMIADNSGAITVWITLG